MVADLFPNGFSGKKNETQGSLRQNAIIFGISGFQTSSSEHLKNYFSEKAISNHLT